MNSKIAFYLNKSVESLRISNLDSAELYLSQALKLESKNPHTLRLLGVVYAQRKDYLRALKYLNNSLRAFPKNSATLSNLGNVFLELRQYDNALDCYAKSIKIDPNNSATLSNLGSIFFELKQYDKALDYFDKSIKIDSNNYEAWYNKSKVLKELKRYDEAITHYDKVLSLRPDYVEAWSNKGNTLFQLKQYEEAIAHYDRAINLKVNYAEAWSNKGATLHELKQFSEAIAHYDKALSLKPDYHDASWSKSLTLLLQGDFENGLPLYESRWDSEKVSETVGKRIFDKPTWLGVDSLAGKRILIYGEQGLGDFIQFCRYVKLVAELGANVILEVPQSLASLMKNLDGISQLVIKGEDLPFFDYQCPLLSLPLAFKTNLDTIPSPSRYINLNDYSNKIMEWKVRLSSKLKPRVGLVWSGNPHHKNDHNRSILLRDILPFLPNQCEYVSLQKEVREVDKLTLDSNPRILNFAGYLNDFLDTAALINNLDLVIGVDTSVVHLSGALGKKTLLLLPYVPDWRWLLDRDGSPWYPSVKIYRQSAIGDWNSVFDRVKLDLNSSYS